MWQAILLTTVLGLFAVVFLAGITLIGLEADPPGDRTAPPSPAAEEGEGSARLPALPSVAIV